MRQPGRLPAIAWLLAPLPLGAGLAVVLLLLRSDHPESPVAVGPLPELPASTFAIPFTYDGRVLIRELEARIPRRLGGLDVRQAYPSDPRLRYAFEAEREAFDLRMRGDTVEVSTSVRYGGQVWYATPLGVELTPSCGIADGRIAEDAPQARIHLAVVVSLDADWAVQPGVRVEGVEPRTPADRCRVSVLQFELDATEPILSAVSGWLEGEAKNIELAMSSIETRPYAEDWWAALGAPLPLADDTWLALDPLGVGYRTRPGDDGRAPALRGELVVTARPEVIVGAKPHVALPPLPPLRDDPPAEAPWVTVDSKTEYGRASEYLTRRFGGSELRIVGKTVRLGAVRLSPADGSGMGLEVRFEGDVSGRVRFVGTPVLDPLAGEITVPDLDFTLSTDSRLAQAAGWVAHRALLGRLRQRVRIATADVIAAIGEPSRDIHVALSDEAELDGTLAVTEITRIAATPDALVVRARVRPHASLQVGTP